MAQNEVYRIGLDFTIQGGLRTAHTAFYVKQTTVLGFTVADVAAEVVNGWNNAFTGGAALKSFYAADTTLDSITMRKWDPLSPTVDTYATGLPSAGTAGGQGLPANSAVVVSLRTANIGRSYRGRMYMPAVSEAIANENLSAGQAEDIAIQWAGIFTALRTIGFGAGADAQAVVWSKLLSAATPITDIKVDEFLRSQRRRNPRTPTYQSESI